MCRHAMRSPSPTVLSPCLWRVVAAAVLVLVGCDRPMITPASPTGPISQSAGPSMLPSAKTPVVTAAAAARSLDGPSQSGAAAPTAAFALPFTVSPAPKKVPPQAPIPLPVTGEVTLRLLNQRGGLTESVAVEGERVYAGMGPRLVALSAAQPTALELIGQSEVLPGLVRAVVVHDGTAYLGAGAWLVALDVHQPNVLTPLGNLALPGPVTCMALKDDLLVVGMGLPSVEEGELRRGALATVDLSQSDQPQLLDLVYLPWRVQGLATAGDVLYAGTAGSDALYAVDMADAADLGRPVALPISSPVYSLRVYAQRLYVGSSTSDVSVWDIRQPFAPKKLWEVRPVDSVPLGIVQDFVPAGELIYIATAWSDGRAFATNAIALQAPESVEGAEESLTSARAIVQGERMWVADHALTLYNVADQSNIVRVARYAMEPVADVALSGEIGIVVGGWQLGDMGSLYTVGLPRLEVLGRYVDEPHCKGCPSSLTGVTVEESTACVGAWGDGLRVLSLADPQAPALLGRFEKGGLQVEGKVVITGGRAYAGVRFDSGDQSGLAVFDLASPSDPQLLATVFLEGDVEQVAVTQGILYATASYAEHEGSTLYLFDATSRELQQIGAVEFSSRINDVQARSDLALVATSEGISVISARDPANPEAIAELPVPGGAYEMVLVNNIVLVTTAELSTSGQLLVIQLADPAAPHYAGAYHLPAGRAELAVSGRYVLLGNLDMGLAVLRLDGEEAVLPITGGD